MLKLLKAFAWQLQWPKFLPNDHLEETFEVTLFCSCNLLFVLCFAAGVSGANTGYSVFLDVFEL